LYSLRVANEIQPLSEAPDPAESSPSRYTSKSVSNTKLEALTYGLFALPSLHARVESLIMENLPVELISMIAARLQERDSAKQPFSHVTETSADRKDGWLVHTNASVRDICDFRLVCSKLRDSSLRSFGDILGDRVFRFTVVGLQDLQAMSKTVKLRPHIQTLTFGNAQFDDLTKNLALKKLFQMLPEPDRTRLRVAYSDAYLSQQRLSKSLRIYKLISALGNLPRLTNLRLLYYDYPGVSNHLGGWLGPHDSALLTWTCAKNHSTLFRAERIYAPYHDDKAAFNPVFEAIHCTGATIRDLRLGPGHISEAFDFARNIVRKPGMQSALSCVSLDIGPANLCLPGRHGNGPIFDKILWYSPNVTRLMLSMYPEASFTKFALAASRLVKILKTHARLDHLTIRGPWSFSEDELIDLLSSHATTLITLALKESNLSSGNWTSMVQRFLDLQPCAMQYLELTNMSALVSSNKGVPAFDISGWQEWETIKEMIATKAKCTVYLSSGIVEYVFQPSAN
jgi:hypothetical protein